MTTYHIGFVCGGIDSNKAGPSAIFASGEFEGDDLRIMDAGGTDRRVVHTPLRAGPWNVAEPIEPGSVTLPIERPLMLR